MEILLMLTFICLSLQDTAKKVYAGRCTDGDISFSAFGTFAALIFFIANAGGKLSLSMDYLPYAIGFAISYSISMIFSVQAVRTGPLSLTTLILSCSLLMPTIYGLCVLNEKVTLFLCIGIALLIGSLALINLNKDPQKKTAARMWPLYVFLAFIGNGACSILQKAQQISFDGAYKNDFMIIALSIASIVLFISALCASRKNVLKHFKIGLPWFILCGGANGIVNLLVMTLSQKVAASIMFPIISAGNIVITLVLSISLFKERLSKNQLLGIILGITAVVFLSI